MSSTRVRPRTKRDTPHHAMRPDWTPRAGEVVSFAMGSYNFKVVVASSARSPLLQEASSLGFDLVPIKIHGIVRNVLRSRLRPLAPTSPPPSKAKSRTTAPAPSLEHADAESTPNTNRLNLDVLRARGPSVQSSHSAAAVHTQSYSLPHVNATAAPSLPHINVPAVPSPSSSRQRVRRPVPPPPPPREREQERRMQMRLGTMHANVPVRRLFTADDNADESSEKSKRPTISRAHTQPPSDTGSVSAYIPGSSGDSKACESSSKKARSLHRVYSSPLPTTKANKRTNAHIPPMHSVFSSYTTPVKSSRARLVSTIPIINTETIDHISAADGSAPAPESDSTHSTIAPATPSCNASPAAKPSLVYPATPSSSRRSALFPCPTTPSTSVATSCLDSSFSCESDFSSSSEGVASMPSSSLVNPDDSAPPLASPSPQAKLAKAFIDGIGAKSAVVVGVPPSSGGAHEECDFEEELYVRTPEIEDKKHSSSNTTSPPVPVVSEFASQLSPPPANSPRGVNEPPRKTPRRYAATPYRLPVHVLDMSDNADMSTVASHLPKSLSSPAAPPSQSGANAKHDENDAQTDKGNDDEEKSHYGFHPLFGGDDTSMSPPSSPTVSPRRQAVGVWETSNNFRYAFCPIAKKQYSFVVRMSNERGPKLGTVTVFSDSGRLKYVAGHESFTGTISKHITWDDGEIWRRPHPMYMKHQEEEASSFPIYA